jgi:uncharacterized protein YegJ (DUF2314 family)
MWIRVESIEPDGEGGQRIKGTLASEPVYARGLRSGAAVTVTPADVGDWTYQSAADPTNRAGGFTDHVLKQIRDEQREN